MLPTNQNHCKKLSEINCIVSLTATLSIRTQGRERIVNAACETSLN